MDSEIQSNEEYEKEQEVRTFLEKHKEDLVVLYHFEIENDNLIISTIKSRTVIPISQIRKMSTAKTKGLKIKFDIGSAYIILYAMWTYPYIETIFKKR